MSNNRRAPSSLLSTGGGGGWAEVPPANLLGTLSCESRAGGPPGLVVPDSKKRARSSVPPPL